MSAVYGIFHRDGNSCLQPGIDAMHQQLAFRAPHGHGVWQNESIALGVLGPSPFSDPHSGLTIAAVARLDDRRNLIRKLGIDSGLSDQSSDSALILSAYGKWGRECADHLLGDFAFAIWDPGEKQLFCARDHIGARPFYYHVSRDLFVFGSSARAVAAHPMVPADINRARVADLLVDCLESVNETTSFFKSVHRLPPAHTLRVSPDHFSIQRYWQLDPKRELQMASDEEYADALQSVMEDAIRDRLPHTGPVASMLSGGIDSSTIVGISRELLKAEGKPPILTFSGVSDVKPGEAPCRETYFVDSVIAHGGLQATRLSPLSAGEFQQELQGAEKDFEDPFDFSWILHKLIYLNAVRSGCRVVFDGVDGDVVTSLTSSYPAYLLRAGRPVTAIYELRKQYQNYFRRKLTYAMAGRIVLGTLVPKKIHQLRLRRQSAGFIQKRVSDTFLSPDLAAEVRLGERFAGYQSHGGVGFKPSLRHEHIKRIITPDLTSGVERYARLAGGFGVDNRQPLLDRRMLEFCVSLPWDQKCRDGWSKFALRNVASRFLPTEVAWRPGWEEIAWKFNWALRELTRKEDSEYILDQGESLAEYINWPKAREHCLTRLHGNAEFSASEGTMLGFIKWHGQVSNL